MDQGILAYNAAQPAATKAVCDQLADEITGGLPQAEGKVWHGGPVWFIAGNPILGYWVRKKGIQLLFWSGQSLEEPGLKAGGKFKAAEAYYAGADDIDSSALARWLEKAARIQWDYKNIVKRKGKLEKIGAW